MKRRQLLFVLFIIMFLTACGRPSEEQVRKKMQQELYEEYGEEFVVDRIGMRSANGVKFYQARIYPKSIIGTEKEDDSYYYSTASVDLDRFKKANSVGNSYGTIKMNDEAEEYLLSKAKELFGERIRLKADVKYKVWHEDFYSQYLVSGFEEKRKEALENPDTQRFELTLYVYIFDRIDSEEEREERREQIFDFIQYLKVEGLFEYLEMWTMFIDTRELSPLYKDYIYDSRFINTAKEEVNEETVYLPQREIRKEMSEKLLKDILRFSEKEILDKIKRIKKSDLSYETLDKYNSSHYGLVYSVGILESKYNTQFERYKKNNELNKFYYKNLEDIRIDKNLEYIYY